MPITNSVIVKLNEITALVEDKARPSESDIEEIKSIFTDLVKCGERYDMDELESWFENEGSWNHRARVRVVNLANYVQDKYQQTAHLRVLSDDGCGC